MVAVLLLLGSLSSPVSSLSSLLLLLIPWAGGTWDGAGEGTGTTPTAEGPGDGAVGAAAGGPVAVGAAANKGAVRGVAVVGVGAVVARETAPGVRLSALTNLLVIPSPRTTLLNISLTFNCRLFSKVGFLPFDATVGAAAPPTGPRTKPPNLNDW